jgi:N-acetyl-alpha-D-muramate 1-phosphate uridylyltransferase
MTGMILAAGFGSRLGGMTSVMPKPLLPVAGRPMIAHAVEALKRAGCDVIVVNAHHHADQLQEHFGQVDYAVQVYVSVEQTLLGTGGGILHARDYLADAPFFFLHNSDIYTDADPGSLLRTYRGQDCFAAMLVQRRRSSRAVMFDGQGRFLGKESWRDDGITFPGQSQCYAYCGVQVISRAFFDLPLPPDTFIDLFDCYRIALGQGAVIMGCEYNGYWTDLGTPERIDEHEQRVAH